MIGISSFYEDIKNIHAFGGEMLAWDGLSSGGQLCWKCEWARTKYFNSNITKWENNNTRTQFIIL